MESILVMELVDAQNQKLNPSHSQSFTTVEMESIPVMDQVIAQNRQQNLFLQIILSPLLKLPPLPTQGH